MDIRVYPSETALSGSVPAISSKSDVHRALICAAFSASETTIGCNLLSKDMEATMRCLNALGADISYSREAEAFFVSPIQPDRIPAERTLDCGESGSTLRFLLPVAAALPGETNFTGSGRLPERPVGVLLDALTENGVLADSDRLPLRISGKLHAGDFSLPGNISSQFVTGLLLSFPLLRTDAEAADRADSAAAGASRLRLTSPLESRDYVEITRAVMERFGCPVLETADGYCFHTPEHSENSFAYRSPGSYTAEGDWSNAAFLLAADALQKKYFGNDKRSALFVTGLSETSPQADRRIKALTAAAERDGCFRFDASYAPDLVPIAAVLAAYLPGISEIYHAERLRIKECDRLAAMTETLTALGAPVEELSDGLVIRGCGGRIKGGVSVSGWNDHRIVMALCIAALYAEEAVTILGAEAVEKSYPTFFEDIRRLGGRIDVI